MNSSTARSELSSQLIACHFWTLRYATVSIVDSVVVVTPHKDSRISHDRKPSSDKPRHRRRRLCLHQVLLERANKRFFLLRRLIGSVTELGGRIDPLEVDLLQCRSLTVNVQTLAQRHDSLLHTRNRALQHHPIVADAAITYEAAHSVLLLAKVGPNEVWDDIRGDGLLGNVELGGSIALIVSLAHTVDLVIAGGTMMVAHLTCET